MKAWFDVALLRCLKRGRYYFDVSWYVVKMESDIECRECGTEFNSKKNAFDRLMEFQIDINEKAQKVRISDRLKLDR